MANITTVYQRSLLTMIALGIGTGFLLKFRFPISETTESLIDMAGDVLLTLLQMFAVPLIVTSVISGVTALNTKLSGKAAVYILIYVCGSTATAVSIGLFLVLTIEPGADTETEDFESNMAPESFFLAFFEHYESEVVEVSLIDNNIDYESGQNDTELKIKGEYVDGANMLGLIVWSFTIGILINRAGRRGKVAVNAARELNNAIKIIFKYILWYMPIGIYFLMITHVLEIEDWTEVIKLGKLIMVLFLGFAVHSIIGLPIIYFAFTRENPFLIYRQVYKALINALTMASSSATLPVTLQCCEENMKVDVRFCRLTLPIVSTINMNGMAIYEVVAAVFIAELAHINLSASYIISIGLTSAVASFGAAGVPMLGPASTILILTSVGLPAKDVSILMVFEWFVDHFATMVNVLGDCFGIGIISHLCQNELKELDHSASGRSIVQIELDLSCLEPNDQLIPS
ncbi:excitatory amino acid transporter 3-like isoform X2 [Gambusia affinis]|uniref:excitatory amino acid transporter 3-like isoform X2 n=1 Tax=Gambusia affinis TaxID=33528 RepID=UPI001CDD3BB7|nr:excitatory amino acid transporter 3-like isoform X2 [Gambusia affinis]